MLSPPPLSREKPWGSIPLSDLSWSPAGPWGNLAPWPLHPRLWKSVFLPRCPSLVLPLRATSACLLLQGRASQESLLQTRPPTPGEPVGPLGLLEADFLVPCRSCQGLEVTSSS